MSTASTIRTHRVKAGISQATLAESIGVDRSAVAQWENGITRPRIRNLRRLASFFKIPLSVFLDEEDDAAESQAATVALHTLGKVHAGLFSEEEITESVVEVPASVLAAHPSACAVLVEGDCMDRVIPEGVVALYDPELEPSNGQIVIVETENHEALMRRWYRGENTLMLVADSHTSFSDIVVEADTPIRLIGTVFWMQSPLEY